MLILKNYTMKTIELKFRGIDDFSRPVYKAVNLNNCYFGSVDILISGEQVKTLKDVNNLNKFFRENPDKIELFGTSFNCEPHGGKASSWEYIFIDNDKGN